MSGRYATIFLVLPFRGLKPTAMINGRYATITSRGLCFPLSGEICVKGPRRARLVPFSKGIVLVVGRAPTGTRPLESKLIVMTRRITRPNTKKPEP